MSCLVQIPKNVKHIRYYTKTSYFQALKKTTTSKPKTVFDIIIVKIYHGKISLQNISYEEKR